MPDARTIPRLTDDGEVDERVPGGRGLEVDPAAVHALLALLDILQVEPAIQGEGRYDVQFKPDVKSPLMLSLF